MSIPMLWPDGTTSPWGSNGDAQDVANLRGVTRKIYDILRAGACTSKDVGDLLDLPRSAVSPLLIRLHQRGIAARVLRHTRGRRGRPEFVYFLERHVEG